mmetsp:Transcript_20702/g.46180  ORF Transcript_20702/g.46180 Transcript_20702/m.46180 type:complete len:575 (+) Transcript_20702:37-1761(+)
MTITNVDGPTKGTSVESKLAQSSEIETPSKPASSSAPNETSKATTASAAATGTATSSTGQSGTTTAEEAARREKEADIERELRRQYGDELRFIVANAEAAVREMEQKHGKVRADHLRQHTDNAEQWAVEIGMDDVCPRRKRRTPREVGYLDRLRQYLEQRVDNIRSHVVKLTHPDLFLQETLVKLEDEMDERTLEEIAVATRAVIEKRRKSGLPTPPDGPTDAADMRALLDRVSAPIPPPRNAAGVRDVNLIRVEKIRAASRAMMAYLGLDVQTKAEVKNCLSRSHKIASEELKTLLTEMAGFADEDSRKEGEVLLEDAWNKPLEYDATPAVDDAEPPSIDEGEEPAKKKAKRDASASPTSSGAGIVIRSKVLLTRGRKAPSNLVVALKRKRAEMITPSASGAMCGAGTQLRIEFGSAFEMIINFVPLVVSIRALPVKGGEEQHLETAAIPSSQSSSLVTAEGVPSDFRRTVVDGGLPTWVSSSRGLVDRSSPVSVLGVTGPASTLGPIVAKKLEYASACATQALRRCFADNARKAYETSTSDFEVEISEATALLRFVQLARSTYTPDFQEDDS